MKNKIESAKQSVELTMLTESELSQRIHVSLGTLRRWRLENRGPKFHKLGSLVRYSEYDLGIWLQEQPSGGGSIDLQKMPVHRSASSTLLRRTG